MKIAKWPIDEVIPYEHNPRVIPKAAIDKVAASIENFGWRQCIVVDEQRVIIIGHTRLLAARKLGQTTVPVHVAKGLKPEQVKELRLMDNRSHEESGWNLELLRPRCSSCTTSISMGLTGFEPHEIDHLLGLSLDVPDDKANAAPDLPIKAVSIEGNLWECGPHRVLCGDATRPTDVCLLLDGKAPPLMVCDPPYGVQLDPKWREEAGLGRQRQRGTIMNDDRLDWTAAYRLFPGDVVYLWHAGIHAGEASQHTPSRRIRRSCTDNMGQATLCDGSRSLPLAARTCFFAVRKGCRSHWCGDRTQSTLWQVPNLKLLRGVPPKSCDGARHTKPVEPRPSSAARSEQTHPNWICRIGAIWPVLVADLAGKLRRREEFRFGTCQRESIACGLRTSEIGILFVPQKNRVRAANGRDLDPSQSVAWPILSVHERRIRRLGSV